MATTSCARKTPFAAKTFNDSPGRFCRGDEKYCVSATRLRMLLRCGDQCGREGSFSRVESHMVANMSDNSSIGNFLPCDG